MTPFREIPISVSITAAAFQLGLLKISNFTLLELQNDCILVILDAGAQFKRVICSTRYYSD